MSAAALSIRFCRARDGARLAFARHGDGVPLVKAASWMTHLELDRHSVLWRHWFQDLGPGRSMVFYDGRGYGMSDRAPPQLDLDAMVADLEAVVDASGLERFALLGMSEGGSTALLALWAEPAKLVAIDLESQRLGALDDFIAARGLMHKHVHIEPWRTGAHLCKQLISRVRCQSDSHPKDIQ